MNIKFAYAIATVISALFPGGISEFNKKGQITVLPHPSKGVVVFHPELPEALKTRLLALQNSPGNKSKNQIHFMSTPNFVSLSKLALRDFDEDLIKFFNKLDPSACVLFEGHSNLVVVTMPSIRKDDDESLPLVFGHLKNLEGMILAYVITAKSVFEICPEPVKADAEEKTKMIPNITIRETITQDDVTNFIIDIERSKSIDDIINGK